MMMHSSFQGSSLHAPLPGERDRVPRTLRCGGPPLPRRAAPRLRTPAGLWQLHPRRAAAHRPDLRVPLQPLPCPGSGRPQRPARRGAERRCGDCRFHAATAGGTDAGPGARNRPAGAGREAPCHQPQPHGIRPYAGGLLAASYRPPARPADRTHQPHRPLPARRHPPGG